MSEGTPRGGLVRRPQLADEVAAHLRGLIMSGRLRPGERIRLEDVAEQLGVSITPVREALLTLRGEDMVELEPRRGYIVAPLSKQDILDVFTLQGDIAGELAARAAARLTPQHLADLSTVDRRLARARRSADIERLEFEFHRTVNRFAGARKLSWLLHTATRYTPARFLSSDPGWRATMRTDHEALLAAFAAGDPDPARAVMRRHFSDGADRLVKHLDDLGIWSAT
jgi:DNA-binding GntR family transcriptional regulator